MTSNDYLTLHKAYAPKRSEDLITHLNPLADLLFSHHWKWNNQNGQVQKNKGQTLHAAGSMKQDILAW